MLLILDVFDGERRYLRRNPLSVCFHPVTVELQVQPRCTEECAEENVHPSILQRL